MGLSNVDLKSNVKKSLGMFALGAAIATAIAFFVIYGKAGVEGDIGIGFRLLLSLPFGLCVGWILGGFIWGWSITKKWFPPRPRRDDYNRSEMDKMLKIIGDSIKIFLAVVIGLFAMLVGMVQALILLIMFIINRVKAKQARDAMQAASVENGQSGEDTIKT